MIIYTIIILAIIARFIPHMPNFAPITALAIFSAANMDWKKAVGITLVARFISDIFLGFFSWPLMVAVYACHLAGILFGLWIKKSNDVIPNEVRNPLNSIDKGSHPTPGAALVGRDDTAKRWLKIISSSLGASIIFFLVTNFAFLYSGYSHNLSGIMLSYYYGLPFFRGTLLGDLGYSFALFGAYAAVQAFVKSRQAKHAAIHAN
jgi:hypothetical protein